MEEGGDYFKTSEFFPTSSKTDGEAIYTQQSTRPSGLDQGPHSLRSSTSDDIRKRYHESAYREVKGQKTSSIYPETNYESGSHRIPSKALHNDNHPAYHVFGNLQNRNQPEYQIHTTPTNLVNPQDSLANGVPVVCLPTPDFVLPGIVPCFLKPEDAAQWAASGAELYHPDSVLTSAKTPPTFFGSGTQDLVPQDGQRAYTQGNLNQFEKTHSNTQATPQEKTHNEKGVFTGPPQTFSTGSEDAESFTDNVYSQRPGKRKMKTPLLASHEPINCFTNSMQHSTHLTHQQGKPTGSGPRVLNLLQSEVDKHILPKVEMQLQEETKVPPKGKVVQQCEEPLAQRIYEAPKARFNQKQEPQSHNTKDMGIGKAEDGSGRFITENYESKTNKEWLSVMNSEMSKASKFKMEEKTKQDSVEKEPTKSKAKWPASQNIASCHEQEIPPKQEDGDITGELSDKFQIGESNWADKTYPYIAETEDRKRKTVDMSSSSHQSPLKSKSVMDSDDKTPEISGHKGWIPCNGSGLCVKRPWDNMKNKGTRLTTQYKESNVVKGVGSPQHVANRPVNSLLPHHNHPDDYRIPHIVREEGSAKKLPQESKGGNTLDTDLTTSNAIIDVNNSKVDQNSKLISTLNSKPIPQKNHQLDSRPEVDRAQDMVGSDLQRPQIKGSMKTEAKTGLLNIDDDDVLIIPPTANEQVGFSDGNKDKDQKFVESRAVGEYCSLHSMDKERGSPVSKENSKNKKIKNKNKKNGKPNKPKESKEAEKPLPQSISQIMKTNVGKAILETLQFQNKKRLLPINLDKQRALILADDWVDYKTEGENDQEKRLAWVKTFDEFSHIFGDNFEAQRRVTALLAQFSQKASQLYFENMKDLISEPLVKVLKILKVEEEFPLFLDFDSAKFSNFQKLKSELSEVDSMKLLYMCGEEELNTRIHQMSIMSRIDHSSILFKSHEMKDFIKQGGSLQIVLEIQHNLGFGIEENIWKEMEEYKIKERALNIIYAMLGTFLLQENPEPLWSGSQQWFETYTRDFFFQQPQLSHIFEKRFGILVEYSEKLPPTKLSDWMNKKEASEVGTISQCQLQWGKVMVGVHCGIPLMYLWEGLVLLYDDVDLKYRPGIKDKQPLYWPLNLPDNMDHHFERFKRFFEFFGKRLLLTNKF
ncbi:uncharacterized protein MELLADRAFT_109813 [Melampsora larici-populina 98AG31]|uniref:Uncharacterized protein n=1 Tax=Melampsora larici-populina (strain 98AG31 / pathotype 3-4-7) TaxID=747676 RepID=F4RXQ4_MELLP|nr:uncharacterized protein MELLADRAFT_109813 [Melampsora larici-populina 98AG31]EGG02769.1 hypothetical protein MELLADRAFT_109813 [Melampsora larici-populina 98AG31]